MASGGELLFSYYSSNIYRGDLRLLNAPNWLNDEIITFAMDYSQNELFKGQGVRFISPGTAFIMMHETDQDDLRDTVQGQELTEAKLVCLPVSDSASLTKGGGSHWSLLVFDAETNKFWHFDSAGQSNVNAAAKLAAQLAPFLVRPETSSGDTKTDSKSSTTAAAAAVTTESKDGPAPSAGTVTLPFGKRVISSTSTTSSSAAAAKKKKATNEHFIVADCPQQTNGYDCGVYAVSLSQALAQRCVAGKTIRDIDLLDDLKQSCSPASITAQRRKIGEYIEVIKKRIAKGEPAEGTPTSSSSS